MRAPRRSRSRRGATVVEFAVIAPLLLFLVFTQIIGGLGVARYQEVAHLARMAARYASTHGGTYQREGMPQQTGVAAIASSSDIRRYLKGQTLLLDPSRLQVSVAWTAPSAITPANMPTYVDTDPSLIPPGQKVIQNNVIVTVTYQWVPEGFLPGAITMTSTSQMPMSY